MTATRWMFAAALAVATPAAAQDFDAGAAVDMTGMGIYAMEDAVMDAARGGSPAPRGKTPAPRVKPGAQGGPTTFRFTPSPQTRKAVQAQLVKKTRAADPAQAAQLEALLARTDIIAAMTPPLRALGLSTNDLADAYTAWWITAWKAANGRSGDPSRPQVAAVRQQAARALMAVGAGSAPASAKQEIAESSLIQGAILEMAMAHAAGKPAELRQVATAARQGAKAFGLDLDAMTLTERGFVKR